MNDYGKMGNDEIGEFCLTTGRKLAKDVYAIAKAVQVVHERLKGTKGEFGAWRKKYIPFLSKPTVYRYLAVAKLNPEDIRADEGISNLYRRLHILPAKPPTTTPPTAPTAVARSTKARGKPPAGQTPASVDDLIRWIASQPGAKKQGLTPTVLAQMSEEAIRDMAKQLQPPTGQPAGVTVGDDGPQAGELRAYVPDEDITQEEAEDRREMELTLALSIIGQKAKFHNLQGTPNDLLAFLGEFGVRPEDIAALDVA